MKLIELLLITSEHRNMYIWENGEIAFTSMTDEIQSEELNDRVVESVDCSGDITSMYLISE